MITHSLAVQQADGQVRSYEWKVDIDLVLSLIRGTAGRAFLRRVIEGMYRNFPTWLLSLGENSPLPLLSADGHPYIFTNGKVIDPVTGREADTSQVISARLMYSGKLPIPVTDRPFLKSVRARMKDLDPSEKQEWNQYFLQAGKQLVLLIPVCALNHTSAPHEEQPQVYTHKRLWELLDIHPDHLYGSTLGYGKLCLYGYQRKGIKLHEALQQRVVPRFVMDLLFADIKALGKWAEFESFMRSHGTSLHKIFNQIGRTGESINKKLLHFYKGVLNAS